VRVLYLSKACVVGAYQRKLEELAREPDIELVAAVPPSWHDSGGSSPLERLHTAGYELVVVPVRFNGHFHWHYYPGLGKLLDRVRPDIFHVDEEPYNLATFHAVRSARQRKLPALFFTWQNLARHYPPPFSWMERYVFRHTVGAIAGNREAAVVLQDKGYCGPVDIIPQFGVDPEQFSPRKDRVLPESDPFTIGFAGRLVPEKGLFVLLDAVRQLRGDWRLRVLGRGPLRDALRQRIHDAGLQSRATLEGTRPSAKMPEFYRGLDVLVLPSLTLVNWKEQFGRVLIEAMACGVPVVGSDSGEIPRVIGDAGLVFPEGNSEALAAHLARLCKSVEERAMLGQRGRRRAVEHFTHQQVAQQTAMAYRRFLQSSPPSSLSEKESTTTG